MDKAIETLLSLREYLNKCNIEAAPEKHMLHVVEAVQKVPADQGGLSSAKSTYDGTATIRG